MSDDTKRTPNTPFRPVGTYRGTEPAVTKPVSKVDPDSPEYGPLILDMLGKVQGSMTGIVGRLDGVEKAVADLTEWRKTGRHAPVVLPADGPQTTTSGEVRRISQSDIAQNKAITGLSENQVALSDKVDAIGRKLEASDRRLDAQDKAIATGTDAALAAKDNTVDIKKAVGGFMKQHPEISSGIATLLGLLIALATQWFQAKVHP